MPLGVLFGTRCIVSVFARDESTVARAGFVRFQQALARQALLTGTIGAARVSLRVLRPGDFAGDPVVSAQLLRTLRNPRVSEERVLDAIRALLVLGPASTG